MFIFIILIIIDICIGRCYANFGLMFGYFIDMPLYYGRWSTIEQMLNLYLAYVYQEADVIAFNCNGRCYYHVFIYIALPNMPITVVEADVVCLVEDGKSTFCEVYYVWQMLLPGGRWNRHCIMLFLVLGC